MAYSFTANPLRRRGDIGEKEQTGLASCQLKTQASVGGLRKVGDVEDKEKSPCSTNNFLDKTSIKKTPQKLTQ